MKGLAYLAALILFLVALLAGGCSLYFTALGGIIFGDPGLLLIWLSGFLLCAAAIWGGRRLWRYGGS